MVEREKQAQNEPIISGIRWRFAFTRLNAIFLFSVLLFVIFSLGAFADTQGCYLYPGGSEDYLCQDNVLEVDAAADCALHNDCDFNSMFVVGESCSNYPEVCEEVTCSVDCDTHSLAKCENLGGRALESGEYDLWCSEGCCSVGNFCEYVDIRYDCVERALQQGFTEDDISLIIENMDQNSCQTTVCGVELSEGTVGGYVLDELGDPITSATVELTSTLVDSTGFEGYFSFLSVSPGSYVLQATAPGYSSVSTSLSVSPGEAVEINLTLLEAGETFSVGGVVFDDLGPTPIADVSVCFESNSQGTVCTTSLIDGSYSISGLQADDYDIILTKYGYASSTESLTLNSDMSSVDLTINTIDLQGISGITLLDENGDGLMQGFEGGVYGASIYVDGVYRTNSQYPEGNYDVQLEAGTYTVTASYQDYASQEYEITVGLGEVVDLNPVLQQEIGECSFGQPNQDKPVEVFSGIVSQGEAEVVLSWEKPCNEVSGYIIMRDGVPFGDSFSPLAISTVDTDVEWGQSYTYSIQAVYTDGPLDSNTLQPQVRESTPTLVTVTIGNLNCEDREVGATFCVVDDSSTSENERKYVYSCTENNDVVVSTDCASLDDSDSDYFCTATSETYALCKDAGSCSILGQEAEPFGLYYDSDSCYGPYDSQEGYDSFCYYDYTETSIVDACYSCEEVVSCFDYISQGSCEINNCLGVGCTWVDSSNSSLDYGVEGSNAFLDAGYLFPSTEQTGHGYCVEEEYGTLETSGFDDYCSLCGPDADLFENSYCTADVCSNLGRCFADEEVSSCDSCGDAPTLAASCYTYNSAFECRGEQDVSINSGVVSASSDSCSWNVCAWQESLSSSSLGEGLNGYCFKDGNADGLDDCRDFSSGQHDACVQDIYAPVTTIDTETFQVVSTAYPNVTFLGVDSENPMGQLGYCVMSSDASDCDEFEYVDYSGVMSSEEVVIDLVESSFLSSSEIDGESYVLRYFSLDKYYNQESVREAIIFVDNHLPEFTIEWEGDTEADLSELQVYLSDMNEAMTCDFSLDETYPLGDSFSQSSSRDEEKEATFSGLDGIIYNLTVECFDDYGNKGVESQEIVFDLEQDITLVYPEYNGVISETSVQFSITTAVSASCELYDVDSGLKLADFITSGENKEHQTNEVAGFFEGEYSGDVQVICVESLDGDVLEDYFFFRVDFTAPDTEIVLTEGARVEEPIGYGWEEYFVEEVQVDFRCAEDDGFACAKTYYCLGSGCEFVEAPGYQEYTSSVTVTDSTDICYYSEDEAGSVGYPDCGEIRVEGFGIVMTTPTQFYYQDEVWGVSNEAVFNWDLLTKVDTQTCAFDFNSGFDLNSQPQYKQIPSLNVNDNTYQYQDFPGDVLEAYGAAGSVKRLYVSCEDYLGDVGPDQLMNLEYDPSPPVIESQYANPDFLSEGVETYLYVDTDDKTLCKFSDNRDGQGSLEYDTMEYSFPGLDITYADRHELFTNHETAFGFSFAGATQEYLLNVQCMNGAGDLSSLEEIVFQVDYSVSGHISSISPSGYIQETDITLEVETSKNGQCSYDGIVMENTGGTSHSQVLGTLDEGEYQYLIVCMIEGSDREAEAAFTIDLTAPTITDVDDGSYTCSLDTASLIAYTDDEAVSSYYYELYELSGSSSLINSAFNSSSEPSSSSSGSGTLLAVGTMPSGNSTIVSGLSLVENASYYFEVSATDAAGNAGSAERSNGFIAVSEHSERCAEDDVAPRITVQEASDCLGGAAEIECTDDLGCAGIQYGFSASSSTCVADQEYFGTQIEFDSSGWVCYYAEDVNGNNVSGSTRVTFEDSDGDTVANSCDLCQTSTAGAAVDLDGCGYGEVPDSEQTNDQDNDGLPDTWEVLYDSTSCPLSGASSDSNGNGILDTNEDYDSDGYTNYEEYRAGYNPCIADGPVEQSGSEVVTEYEDSFDEFETNTDSQGREDSSMLAVVFFLFGLLLLLGGAGGLYYAYAKDPQGRAAVAQFFGRGMPGTSSSGGQGRYTGPRGSISGAAGGTGAAAGTASGASNGAISWISTMRNAVSGLGKVRNKRSKRKQRVSEFGEFSKESSSFVHLDDVMVSKKKPLAKLGDLTTRYSEHKSSIKRGLHDHEKDLFGQLDSISRKAKGKDIGSVVTEKDAKDIFRKLKQLSDKRGK